MNALEFFLEWMTAWPISVSVAHKHTEKSQKIVFLCENDILLESKPYSISRRYDRQYDASSGVWTEGLLDLLDDTILDVSRVTTIQ